MVKIIDTIFFLIFSATSLLWWVPVFGIFFLPFFVLRQIKRKIGRLTREMAKFSEIKLEEFIRFQKKFSKQPLKFAKKAEETTKGFYNRLVDKVYQKAVWWTRFEIIENVPAGSKVLDIGAGNGFLAKLIAETKNAEVTCVDISDFNQAGFETIIFDGVSLPFEDEEFDVVILSYVLHHSNFQKELLQEARRVCKNKIIIYEDEINSALARRFLAKAHQKAYNWLYDLESPVNYHSLDGWRQIFEDLGFKIEKEKSDWVTGSLVIPVKRAIFVLKKANVADTSKPPAHPTGGEESQRKSGRRPWR